MARANFPFNRLELNLQPSSPVVQSLTNERTLEDWRDWVLHVSDDQGDELFIVPFTFVLGKPH
jgi:hypothetical protein